MPTLHGFAYNLLVPLVRCLPEVSLDNRYPAATSHRCVPLSIWYLSSVLA
jgi:hypothetical protein